MTRAEAENYIYESYLKAEKEWDYSMPDSKKRHPEFSKPILESLNHNSRIPTVLVTGSKGKGSVACMIAQILSGSGNVGLMTSPHILKFNERFRVNGNCITDEEFCKLTEKTKELFAPVREILKPGECISPIGIQCALALQFFGHHQTDYRVFECGKGVKYDDVNQIFHEYAVINSILLEHTRELGNTLSEIAKDKASIMTGDQKCVYVAKQSEEVLKVLLQRAEETNAKMKCYGMDFWEENVRFCENGMLFDACIGDRIYKDVFLPLLGRHQARNGVLAMTVCLDILQEDFHIDGAREMLKNVKWPGRMEILDNNPLTILDACINKESASLVLDVLKEMKISKMTAIVGIPDDKDFLGVVTTISPFSSKVILTKSSNKHYIFTKKQTQILEENGYPNICFKELPDALACAKKEKLPILILGTTSLIADVEKRYHQL